MATRKTTATVETTAAAPAPRAPRKRATKAAAPVIEVAPSPEEAEARLRDEIAMHAYLLWESGAPGDRDTHWLTAERHLRTA